MRNKITFVLLILGLAMICAPMAQASTVNDFSSVVGASLDISATGGTASITFSPAAPADNFEITLGPAAGDYGIITNPTGGWTFTAASVTPEGTGQQAPVIGTGLLTLADGTGSIQGNLALVKIETNPAGTAGLINDMLAVNFTGVTVSSGTPGSELLDFLGSLNEIDFTFQTSASSSDPIDLTDIADGTLINGTGISSYSGEIVPLPGTVLLLGTGLLGLVGLGWRKRSVFEA